MKKHNALKVVLITICICAILTWVLKAASFQTEFTVQDRSQIGLFDLFNYPLTAVSYFGYIAVYMLVVGGFYGILYKIPAYRLTLDKIANKMKKNGIAFIVISMILLSVITSVCGAQLVLLLFFPFIASILLLMGYDKIVVALTLVGSTMVGIIGSTYGNTNIGYANGYLATEVIQNIYFKFAILLAGVALLVLNTILYIKKNNVISKEEVKKVEPKKVEEEVIEEVVVEEVTKKTSVNNSTKSSNNKKTSKKTSSKSKNHNKAALSEEDVIVAKSEECDLVPAETKKETKVWPIIASMILLLIITVLAFIPWATSFGLQNMSEASQKVSEFKIFDWPVFAKLLGTFNVFGEWMAPDMIFPLAFIVIVLAIIYKVKFDDILDGFISGAKKAAMPAFLAILIYTVLVINTYHAYQLNIFKAICDVFGGGFNIVSASITAFLSGVLNVDAAYAVQASIPYIQSLAESDNFAIIAMIYPSMYGLAMLVAPTSVVLMATLSYLGVSYKDWLKSVWKLLLELAILLLVFFLILMAI